MYLKLRASGGERRNRGQMIVLFALSLTAIVLAVGLVIDGGYALAQRRSSQNTSDFASMAGARIVAEFIDENARAVPHANGLDANVKTAITTSITSSGANPITFGAPNGPVYVADDGSILGYVGDGVIPNGSRGVKVGSGRSWTPFFLGVIGAGSWTASTEATAKGGFAAGPPLSGTLFPAGISTAFFQTYPFCTGPLSTDPTSPCYPQHLTPGNLNVPGGFGWLKFGCAGYGLGQGSDGGCDNSKPFLQEEIGPPSDSHGCCTQVGLPGSPDQIGSLPGNKVSADCSYYIDNEIIVTVPIWDTAGGTGQNAYYHIVGFAGFQITNCTGGKDIEGVWRKQFFLGPTTATATNGPWQGLAVQLVH